MISTLIRLLVTVATAFAQCPLRPAPVPFATLPSSILAAAELWGASLCAASRSFSPLTSVQFHARYFGETLISGACGQSSSSLNATSSTLYRIASVSKIFPSLLLAQLAAQQKVHQDATISQTVPDFIVHDPWENSNGSSITWRHLASHMAGLGRTTPAWLNNTEQALAALAGPSGALSQPAGLTPQYSNIGFSLLGHLLAERVLQQPYAQVAFQRIFSPLNVTAGTGLDYTSAVLQRLATGFQGGLLPLPFQPPGFMEPEGGVYSTASNLTFILDQLAAATLGDRAATFAIGLQSAAQARDFVKPLFVSADGSFQQGTPWEMYQLPSSAFSYTVRGKDGGLPGFTSYAGFVPDLRLSVAMLWNTDNVGDIPVSPAFEILIPPLVEELSKVQPAPYPGPSADHFVGTYVSTSNPVEHSGTVTFANETLRFVSLGLAVTFAAVPTLPDSFYANSAGTPPCQILFEGATNAVFTFFRNTSTGLVGGFTANFTYGDLWVKV